VTNSSVSRSRSIGRVAVALAVIAAVGLPALALRLFCVGRACREPITAGSTTPFCDLPPRVREGIRLGFRDGRSPDVLAVAGPIPVVGGTGLGNAPLVWPSVSTVDATSAVPLVFFGTGVASSAIIPEATRVEDVPETIAAVIGLRRPHPRVRSGDAIDGVATGGPPPRLVLEVVLRGIGSPDLRAAPRSWSHLRTLLRRGAGTLEARIGSLPLDPAAVTATLGAGGLPYEHGITGTFVRNDDGAVVRAWGRGSPFAVIATLGDHLDELRAQRPRIGVVGTAVSDRGLIGGNWYVDGDRDDVVIGSGRSGPQVSAALDVLRTGYGRDATPDLLAVVFQDSIGRTDRALRRLVEAAFNVAEGSATVVVTATGSTRKPLDEWVASKRVQARVERELGRPVVEATTLGGMFLDQEILAQSGTTEDAVVRALRQMNDPEGRPLMADVFSGIAVTFGEYC
jgi:hypothetical protein